jgi:hypothetical protein
MSAQEFEHGTGHKFTVKRAGAGSYETCCGHTLESGKMRGLTGFGGKLWYTNADHHVYFGSLQQGKDWLSEEHNK